jgi:hypothetical protein
VRRSERGTHHVGVRDDRGGIWRWSSRLLGGGTLSSPPGPGALVLALVSIERTLPLAACAIGRRGQLQGAEPLVGRDPNRADSRHPWQRGALRRLRRRLPSAAGTQPRPMGGIAAAWELGRELPPVELVQIGDFYFVRDGHHRISVARAMGQEHIEAEVTVWDVVGPLPWEERVEFARPLLVGNPAAQSA